MSGKYLKKKYNKKLNCRKEKKEKGNEIDPRSFYTRKKWILQQLNVG